ncbi:DUF4276 family protein [Mycobacterium sp. UM_Kg1]|uniref:DUF4276 family protein n=1 Tax=Mycobacterium sp. UM_Kg1 TaxID=1545691 RepID=UPI0009E312BD|nr:DUF4276 family protein [Mycobacterium sp. UM_Kg1]
MRIAILTEGDGEFRSLPLLYAQLHASMPDRTRIVKTLKISVQPDAEHGQLVAACRPSLALARAVADRIIVLLDREQQQRCPGEVAQQLETEFKKIAEIPVRVALKDRMYENWLLADLDALRMQPARFGVDAAAQRKVCPNKADSIDGLREIKRLVKNGDYSKTSDSDKICRKANVEKMAANSRSFRHFLHLVGHESYRDVCCSPVQPAQRGAKKRRGRG